MKNIGAENPPSWAVVSTMNEPAPLVLAFACHYLSLGAKEVYLFLDQPDPEAEALLSRLPDCHVTVCTEDYWKSSSIGRKPRLHIRRQTVNANEAYARTDADWLLHVDADEFIRDGANIAQDLAKAPAAAMYMRLLVAERVGLAGMAESDLFAGIFRTALKGKVELVDRVYGALSGFFRDGLTGHMAGKSFVRTRAGLEMSLHAPKGRVPHRIIRSTQLLHFDGLTRLHYMLKLLRRANEPQSAASKRHGLSRTTQFESMVEAINDYEHREALVTVLKELRPDQVEMLRAGGALDERRFDPSPALARYGIKIDLSAAHFDSYLRRDNEKFLQKVAPELLIPPEELE